VDADDVVPRLDGAGGGNGGIYAAAHGCKNSHGCFLLVVPALGRCWLPLLAEGTPVETVMLLETIFAYLFYGLLQRQGQRPLKPCRATVPAVWMEDSWPAMPACRALV
jgi:hypothetical protein